MADASTSEDLSFTGQCPKLLAKADKFARECLEKARTQTRTWVPAGSDKGYPETHSAWFWPAAPGSHFALGCTLNHKRKLDYVGAFYAVNGAHFNVANTAPIRYIDSNGRVGIKVDDRPVNLFVVRQFATDFISQRFKGRVKNCESADLPEGRTGSVYGSFQVHETRYAIDSNIFSLKQCYGNPTEESACRTYDYKEFFPSSQRKIIYDGKSHSPIFIRDGGDLLVRKDRYDESCAILRNKRRTDTGWVVYELCQDN